MTKYKFMCRQLVKAMDQDRLQLFMECLGHIFRGAENCLHQGIEMEIPPFDDEGEDSEGWQ